MKVAKYHRLVLNRVRKDVPDGQWQPLAGEMQVIDFNFRNGVSTAATAEDILRFRHGGREEWEMEVRLLLVRQPPRRRQRLVKQIREMIQ
jgi:hypothetical protein